MSPHPENADLDVLIGTWRTQGDVFGEDGETPIARVDGFDHFGWLGRAFVIHRIDVEMGGERVEGLEIIGPYLPDRRAFATRAYDHLGSEQTSTATLDDEGVWTFRADGEVDLSRRTVDAVLSMLQPETNHADLPQRRRA